MLSRKIISTPLGLLIGTMLVSACGDMPTRPAEEQDATAAADYGRAFGRVVFVEDGKEKDWSSFSLAFETLTLFVRSLQGGEMQYMSIGGKGEFSWPLRPGDYVIVGYQTTREPNNQRRTARLWTTFSVSRAGQAIYIGDLHIETTRSAYRFTVVDDYAKTLAAREASFKQANFEAVKALMRAEEQLGTYKRVVGICAGWGIKCDDTYQGVEPVLPEGTVNGFPTTADLMPLLEWKPSTKPGVTYDVVIFESLSFMYGVARSVDRMYGARVAYAEALHEPSFRPQAPLEPGKKYAWTVRMRDGETVSGWSATSRSIFLVVAGSRGSGRAFGFETPSR